MKQEHIYGLYWLWNDEKHYFYVGRSKRDPKERFTEHIRNSIDLNHKEDVYQFIRAECMPCDVAIWYHDVICWCEDNRTEDYEDFYVIQFIRDGHDLKNMKHGDQKKIAALLDEVNDLRVSNTKLESVNDLRVYRHMKEYERSNALKRKILLQEQAEKERIAQEQREAAARRGRTPEEHAKIMERDRLREEAEALMNRGKQTMSATGVFHKLFETVKK